MLPNMTITLRSYPRWKEAVVFTTILVLLLVTFRQSHAPSSEVRGSPTSQSQLPVKGIDFRPNLGDGKFHWANVPQQHPVQSMTTLPTPTAASIPRIQFEFGKESASNRELRLKRLELVKGNFTHAWKGYKDNAWLKDEVAPISGSAHNHFGGWAATLVDSLGK